MSIHNEIEQYRENLDAFSERALEMETAVYALNVVLCR